LSTVAAPSHTNDWAGPPLKWLPAPLRVPTSLTRSVAIGWLCTFPISIGLAWLVQLLAPDAKAPEFEGGGLLAFSAIVILSPVVETLLMGGVLLLLLRFLPPVWAVLASSAAWGIAHSLMVPTWGLVIWWPFLIFSTLFVTWRQRSTALAFAVPMMVHALQNLPPALAIAAGVKI
jgi:hypothetical protein